MQPELRRILETSLGSMGLKRRVKEMTAVLSWPAVVGPELARRTHARYLQGGILFVGTAGPAWSHQLSMMRPTLISKLNAQLGERIVNDIRFSVGLQPADEAAATAEPRRTPLPEAPIGPEIQVAAESLPDDLREAFLKLGRMQSRVAAARRASDPTVCRFCGQPTGSDTDVCPVCRVTAANTRRVQVRAALAQNSSLSWTEAADLVPGLKAQEYRGEHDDLMTQFWNAYSRARDAGDPETIRRTAIAYLACKYSKPAATLPEEEISQLAKVPVARNRTNE